MNSLLAHHYNQLNPSEMIDWHLKEIKESLDFYDKNVRNGCADARGNYFAIKSQIEGLNRAFTYLKEPKIKIEL